MAKQKVERDDKGLKAQRADQDGVRITNDQLLVCDDSNALPLEDGHEELHDEVGKKPSASKSKQVLAVVRVAGKLA